MLHREHLAGPTEAGLDLVRDQGDLVLAAERAKAGKKVRRRHHESTLALHRFHQDAGDAICAHGRLEQLAHGLDAGPTESFRSNTGWTTSLVRLCHLVLLQ